MILAGPRSHADEFFAAMGRLDVAIIFFTTNRQALGLLHLAVTITKCMKSPEAWFTPSTDPRPQHRCCMACTGCTGPKAEPYGAPAYHMHVAINQVFALLHNRAPAAAVLQEPADGR